MTAAWPPLEPFYARRAETFKAEAQGLERSRRRLSNGRLIVGLALGALLIWTAVEWQATAVPFIAALVVLFALLVRRYRQLTVQYRRALSLQTINEESAARVLRDWSALSEQSDASVPDDHPYAGDLDIFGHASLFRLIDTTTTIMGAARLRSWLLAGSPPDEVAERQAAVSELARDVEWLQELQYLGRLGHAGEDETARFLSWAKRPAEQERRFPFVWLARLSLAVMAVIFLLSTVNLVDAGLLVLPVLANIAISFVSRDRIGDRIEAARQHHESIRSYGGVLAFLETSSYSVPILQRLDSTLRSGNGPASDAVKHLDQLLSFAVHKGSLQHTVLQAVCCWDIHLLDRLERWRSKHGSQVEGWLDVIGWFEALGSFGALRHDNPDWAMPALTPATDSIVATGIGHPLISESRRVTNDLTVGPPGTFLFVTGSNMSGKSTLLRSIGVNVVLANAGAPACARSLELPPVDLWTSVRIVDSLEHGVSYYMAELLRLKQIVDAANTPSSQARMLCYLLDEVLQGTNTAERQIAARQITSLLLERHAIGAVSSHDLDLIDTPALSERAHCVHFSETIDGDGQVPGMVFDYRLRPGLATSSNALKLMEMVGIPLPKPEPENVR